MLWTMFSRNDPALIGATANNDFCPGSPDGIAPRTDYAAAVRRSTEMAMAAGTGEPTVSRLGASGGDTCHVDVIDRWGNMVSATPSAGWLQSSPTSARIGNTRPTAPSLCDGIGMVCLANCTALPLNLV